jgi:hypothetical protein
MRSASARVGYGPSTTRYTTVFVPGVWPETTRAVCPSTEMLAARCRADGSERYAANETVHPRARADSAAAVSAGSRGGAGRGMGARGGRAAVVSPGAGCKGVATATLSELSGGTLVESEPPKFTG